MNPFAIALLLFIPSAYAATYNVYIPDRIVISSWNGSPPHDVVYFSTENGHIKIVSAMTGVYSQAPVVQSITIDDGSTLATADDNTTLVVKDRAIGPPQIVFFVVPNGNPCLDPTTKNPNGTPVFATGVFVDGTVSPGTAQQLKLSTTTVAIPSGNTLCADSTGDFSSSSGVVTFQIGP